MITPTLGNSSEELCSSWCLAVSRVNTFIGEGSDFAYTPRKSFYNYAYIGVYMISRFRVYFWPDNINKHPSCSNVTSLHEG